MESRRSTLRSAATVSESRENEQSENWIEILQQMGAENSFDYGAEPTLDQFKETNVSLIPRFLYVFLKFWKLSFFLFCVGFILSIFTNANNGQTSTM